MKFDILTIFPQYFDSVFSFGLFDKAKSKGLIEINTHDIRNFSSDKHKTVDDKPYGGTGGMLFKPEPLGKAIEKVKGEDGNCQVILTSPAGVSFSDKIAKELSSYDHLIFVCGRYEGIDQRISELYVDREISVGDYVVSGGESAASIMIDAICRYIPGFMGNENSYQEDSFTNVLIEYPHYTRPKTYKNLDVPDVLISGNHRDIEKWRRNESIKRTFFRKNESLDKVKLSTEDYNFINKLKNENPLNFHAYIALIHYPIYNNAFKIITTACTNLDIHDIARSSLTYGVKKFYIVQPNVEQQEVANRVVEHWTKGPGSKYNKTRSEALKIVDIKNSIEEVNTEIESTTGLKPITVVTDARIRDNMTGYSEIKGMMGKSNNPLLILFGTGWGLTKETIESADFILKPLFGFTDYNHLSVRSAAAIILDRLFSCTI